MKKRMLYLSLICLVIVLGLLSRKLPIIPLFVGDGLWATTVYLGWRFVLPHYQVRYSTLLAMVTTFLVETSQLIQVDWLVAIRQTMLGHLLLGQGFLWSDLLAYSVGIAIVALLDCYYITKGVCLEH